MFRFLQIVYFPFAVVCVTAVAQKLTCRERAPYVVELGKLG